MENVMRRVLVANRGEIACRIFRTCRSMGLGTVAVYSEPDRRARHVSDADVSVPLDGETSGESYLDIDKVLGAAAATGADAIHPGYGFLAENAEFAESCIASGLTWIGPPPAVIRSMALKVEAKTLAAGAGLPLLPGATISGDDPDLWIAAAASVQFPLIIKASAGGGGKGMRRVDRVEELVEAIEAARREAASSFGDPTVFIERYLESSRHVEVQVMADKFGSVIHLFDRDCSLQRRHQKVVEEAPAPGLTATLRRSMQDAAVTLTRTIGYEGAGTMEFLVADDTFFFLEMNTRLQVEHPVTEEITGLDLVRLQIEVASGRPLSVSQDEVSVRGHAVEVRLYAEDPARDFMPSVGTITRFEPPRMPEIRWESGVGNGSVISSHYDPMLAKVIAHAATREEATLRLARGLGHLRVSGLRTNRDFLVATLESESFLDGEVSTAFFADHPEVLTPEAPGEIVNHAAVVLAVLLRHLSRPSSSLSSCIPPGWRSLPAVPQIWEFSGPGGPGAKPIIVSLYPPEEERQPVSINGRDFVCELVSVSEDEVDTVLDGVRRTFKVDSERSVYWLSCDAWQIELDEVPRFGVLGEDHEEEGMTSPLPGTVVALEIDIGDWVDEGQLLMVVEAMKMEHRIVASRPGRVTAVLVACGDRVDAHELLVAIESDSQDEGT
jgi:propionyl-CoA carboxylase alpha chain